MGTTKRVEVESRVQTRVVLLRPGDGEEIRTDGNDGWTVSEDLPDIPDEDQVVCGRCRPRKIAGWRVSLGDEGDVASDLEMRCCLCHATACNPAASGPVRAQPFGAPARTFASLLDALETYADGEVPALVVEAIDERGQRDGLRLAYASALPECFAYLWLGDGERLSDSEALNLAQGYLDGEKWDEETIEHVARAVARTGREVRDCNDERCTQEDSDEERFDAADRARRIGGGL